jgi:hypothetical protein
MANQDSDNIFIQVLSLEDASVIDSIKDRMKYQMLEKLVDKGIQRPLDFACCIHNAHEELEKEFQEKREKLSRLVGEVVMALVRANHKKDK